MISSLFIAIFSGLGGMLGWGTADFFAKKTIDELGELKTLFWAQAIGIIPLLIIFLSNPKITPLRPHDPIFLILLGIFSAVSYLPLYAGFGKGQVSLLSPIFATYSVLVVVFAAIFLHAHISFGQKLAIIIVFLGILLLSTNPREFRRSLRLKRKRIQGVPEVLAATFMYSVWLIFLDRFLNGKSWVFPLLIIRVVASLTLAAYSFVTEKKLTVFKNRNHWKYLAVIGIFDVAAFSSVSYGFSHTSYIGVVTVLSASFSLPTMLLAYLYLKERITSLQTIAALLIICGIVIISLT